MPYAIAADRLTDYPAQSLNLANKIVDLVIPTHVNITLINGWSPQNATNAQPRAYRNGSMIHLCGLVKRTGGITTGHIIGRVPTGYRPQYKHHFVVTCGPSFDWCVLSVSTNGDIAYEDGASGVQPNVYTAFDGMFYPWQD